MNLKGNNLNKKKIILRIFIYGILFAAIGYFSFQHYEIYSQNKKSEEYSLGINYINSNNYNLQRQGIAILEEQSENGNQQAKYQLALVYITGKGHIAKDSKKGFELFLELAKSGNVQAMSDVGLAYNIGDGTKTDIKQALYWYKKAADKANRSAQYHLGIYFYNTKKYDKSIYWLKKSAEKGYPEAKGQLGLSYQMSGKPKEAIKIWQEDVKNGNTFSQYHLGFVYLSNKSTRRQGLELLKKAADKGSKGAILTLADVYYYGRMGVPKNKILGSYYIELASNNGDFPTQILFREYLLNGNLNDAVELLKDRAKKGDKKAKELLLDPLIKMISTK